MLDFNSKLGLQVPKKKLAKEKEMKKITMREVFNQLVKELGYGQGKSMFEWYCQTYGVRIADDCPSTVLYEVFGI